MLLAIRFFEPLFGALIVVPFFGLPPWLLRFKLSSVYHVGTTIAATPIVRLRGYPQHPHPLVKIPPPLQRHT